MAEAARARGYTYLAVTDHSASHGFGDHVTADALRRRIDEVAAWNAGLEAALPPARRLGGQHHARRLARLRGRRCSSALDWVIASVHTSFRISRQADDRAGDRCDREPAGRLHRTPHGRLIGKREPYDIDVEAVAEAATATKTMLEINGNPNRRDLSERHARLAAAAGVRICVNTDAHGVDTLSNMRYGIATARRGWLTKRDVANTRSWRELLKLRGRMA